MTTTASKPKPLANGVVIGMMLGFEDGDPLVVFPSNPSDTAIRARSLCALGPEDAGAEVALLFEDGDPDRPLVVGKLVEPARRADPVVAHDGETMRLCADKRIELRVGKASIIMEADGRITIRGARIVSQASDANHIRGGSIHLN